MNNGCEKSKSMSPIHPLDASRLISKLFYGWMNPYIWRGYRKELTLDDLPDEPSMDERCSVVTKKLIKNWNQEYEMLKHDKMPNLIRAAIKTYAWRLFIGSTLCMFAELCKALMAYSVGQILYYIQNRGELPVELIWSTSDPLAQWTATLIMATGTWVVSAHYYGFKMMLIGLHLRAGCSYLIYQKALKLSQDSLGRSTIGQMVNLLSNDMDKFNLFCIMVPFLWVGPMQAILSLGLLWPMLGPTCLGSVAMLILLMPIQGYLSRQFAIYRANIAVLTDRRVRLVNEIISALRLIKAYAWEYACRDTMDKARKEETDLIYRVNQLKAVNDATVFVSGKLILFITIVFHCMVFGKPLEAQLLFMSIAMLNNVHTMMTRLMPMTVTMTAEACISLKRVNDFLLFEEQLDSPYLIYETSIDMNKANGHAKDQQIQNMSKKTAIEMRKVVARWSEDSSSCALNEINLDLAYKNLMIVCGPVASGKSSLLLALLNELPIGSGKAIVRGQVSYASQEAWIFAGTIRDNILFGAKFQKERYWKVVRCCALIKDFELFESADLTYISEKGVSLSGGQKARVSLARCLYRDCEIYLLDDPLSAVDSHVQGHIFQEAIKGFLAQKTVILATHQLHLLKEADQIMVMEGGSCLANGTYQQLEANQFYNIDYLINNNNNNNEANTVNDSIRCRSSSIRSATGSLADAAQSKSKLSKDIFSFDRQQSLVGNLNQGRSGSHRSITIGDQVMATISTKTSRMFKQQRQQHLDNNQGSFRSLRSANGGSIRTKTPASPTSSQAGTLTRAAKLRFLSELNKAGSSFESERGMNLEPVSIHPTQLNCTGTVRPSTPVIEFKFPNRPSNEPNYPQEQRQNQGPQDESMNKELASPSVWLKYYTTCSVSRFVLMIVIYLLAQVLYSTIDVYLTVWTIVEQHRFVEPEPPPQSTSASFMASVTSKNDSLNEQMVAEQPNLDQIASIYWPLFRLMQYYSTGGMALIYTGLIVALFIFASLKNSLFYANCSRTASILYRKLFSSALFAKIEFFDTTPIGRYLNRATRDTGLIDEALPLCSQAAFEIILQWLSTLILVALVDKSLILPSGLVIILFILVHHVFIKPTRNIQRLENIARSPIFTHLATSLNGLATIRATKVQQEFERRFIVFQDRHSSVFLMLLGCNRWLAVVLDWINCLFIAAVSLWAITSGLNGPSSGLIITSGLMLCGIAQSGILRLAETESLMTSIERVTEYCKLPQEENYDYASQNEKGGQKSKQKKSIKTKTLPHLKNWPKNGSLEFESINLYYGQQCERPVLKNLNFRIKSGQKIGIVGRTGAGKSSIVTVLFRLYDYQGTIIIDGQDTKEVTLRQLRSSISIIPQDPVLFTDTVRQNVDPYNSYSDNEVWRALELAHLKSAIMDMKNGLHSQLSEGGANLSVGQRQLMCLARALLKQNHILVMDEATANVDPSTDEIIQSTVRKQFANWTVLIIAHRLNTIIDCDQILVMDAGKLVEMDEPNQLINRPNGVFAGMVASTGDKNQQKLIQLARQAHQNRFQTSS